MNDSDDEEIDFDESIGSHRRLIGKSGTNRSSDMTILLLAVTIGQEKVLRIICRPMIAEAAAFFVILRQIENMIVRIEWVQLLKCRDI